MLCQQNKGRSGGRSTSVGEMEQLLSQWDRCYPGCVPVGHVLRTAFPDWWVRFHSLPESKRYPEDESEYAELLTRHNRVLKEMVKPGEQVVLVTTGYADSLEPERYYPELATLDPNASFWRSVAMHDLSDQFAVPIYWHFFTSRWNWQPGLFDPIVRLVADNILANVLIVSEDCRWILHPYDGGIDIIAETTTERDMLRDEFSPWLSGRTDGL